MTELFLVLYSPKDETLWECYSTVHDLSVAADISLELNTKGFRTNVQSVLLDEYGQVFEEYVDDWSCKECGHTGISEAEDACPECDSTWAEQND